MSDDYILFKIVTTGDSGVGKTQLIDMHIMNSI